MSLLLFVSGVVLGGGLVAWLAWERVQMWKRRAAGSESREVIANAELRRERFRHRVYIRVERVSWSSPAALLGKTVDE